MKFHDTLNEKIWDLNTEDLIPEVKEKLEEIADAFIEFLEIPTDAVLDKVITGSSASYNYNKYSDLDLHIIVDYDKVHEDCPLVNGYLNSLKKQFNDNHDITIHGVPVELYAEQKDQGTVHNGLYSLQTGWIDKPQKIAPTDNDAAVEAKYNEIKELVDKCDDSEEATELLEKIYNMRKAGLAEAGEFCTENLAFKKLRNEGCMDKLRQIKKEQIDKQLSLESYNESNDNLKEQIKQLFPWIYSTTVYNIGEVFDDRGIINLNFEIEGGRSDNEIFIWVFQDNLEIWYTNGVRGGRSHVGSIKIDDITKDNFIASVMDLLKLAKSTIEEFYKKEEKRQKEEYSKTRTYDIEDDEKELYAFISKTLKSIKKQLNKEFSIHQTDNTIYINYDKKPENTVFVEPVEDSTQILKIGLLDGNNDEIDYRELDLEDFGKTDINNIINTIKELFMNKNESIKEAFINEPNKKITVYFSNYVENGQFVSKPLDIIIGQYYAKPGSEYIRKVTGYDPEYNNVWVAEYNPSYDKILRDKSKDYRDFENLASQEQIDFFNKVQQEQENKEQNIEHYAVMDKATGNVWTYKTREERDKKYKEVRDNYSGNDYIDVRKAYLNDDGDFVKWESYCNKNESLNKLEETLKKVEDMEINEGMWASPFTMENAKQVAEILSKPITYEELNSEEGKQKVWNIIGDDEFWDNVTDEALDNPEEDARYLIVKFLDDWMERKESFNDDAYSQEAENIIKKAISMFNGITEDMATLEKKVDTADNDLHDIITSLENTMSEALKE